MRSDRDYTDDDLVPVAIAARMIGVTRGTMRKYSDDGLVPTHRTPGNQRRFRVGDVRKLLVPAQRTSSQDSAELETDDPETDLAPRVGAA